MFGGFQQISPVTSISGLLFSQDQKQTIKRDSLLQARKNLDLKDQDFRDLLYNKKKLGCSSFKTAMKKHLARKLNHHPQLIIGNGAPPTLFSFLTPYVKKVTFIRTEPELYFPTKRQIQQANIREKKLLKLLQKLKRTKSLNIRNSMQKWILNSMRYLIQLKALVLTSDGSKKTEEPAGMLKCHKQFNLEELTFNLSTLIDAESDLIPRKPSVLLFFDYLSQQKAVKSFNLTLKSCHENVPKELAVMLQKLVFSSDSPKAKLKVPGALSKLLTGPEASKFQADLDILMIAVPSSQTEKFFSEAKKERRLFITEGFEKRETSRFILTQCTNISVLYLETTLTHPFFAQENILYSKLAKLTLRIKEEGLADFQHLETLLKHIKQLQSFDFSIDNLNLANAQQLAHLYAASCFNSLKQFSLSASTKYTYDPITYQYLPSIIDLDLLKSLQLYSFKTVESLSLSFDSKLSISIADIINEVGSLQNLQRLDLYIQSQKMTQQPLDFDPSKLSLLKDFRLTIYLAQGDFELLCQNLLKLENLATFRLTALSSSQARIDHAKIVEIMSQTPPSQKFQDITLKDPFKTFNFNPHMKTA